MIDSLSMEQRSTISLWGVFTTASLLGKSRGYRELHGNEVRKGYWARRYE